MSEIPEEQTRSAYQKSQQLESAGLRPFGTILIDPDTGERTTIDYYGRVQRWHTDGSGMMREPTLKAYMADDGAPEEVAILVIAHSVREARSLAYNALRGLNGDCEYTDMRVRWKRDAEHLFRTDADPDKLARDEAHVVDAPTSCDDCMFWGEPIDPVDGLCEACADYQQNN